MKTSTPHLSSSAKRRALRRAAARGAQQVFAASTKHDNDLKSFFPFWLLRILRYAQGVADSSTSSPPVKLVAVNALEAFSSSEASLSTPRKLDTSIVNQGDQLES